MYNIKAVICGFFLVFAAIVLSACKKTSSQEPTKISEKIFRIRAHMDKLYKQGQQDAAMLYLDSATSKLNLTSVEQWSLLNTKTAYFLRYKKQPDSALNYADSLIKVVKDKPELLNFYVSALFVRGDVLMDLGIYEDAFDAYISGGKLSKLTTKCYSLYSKLAMLRYRQGFYAESIPYFKKGFQEILVCADTTRFEQSYVLPQSLLNTLGLCFQKLKQPDSAIFYYQKTLAFIEGRKKIFPKRKKFGLMAQGVVYGNMATALMQKEDYKQAEKFLLKSIEINSKKGFEVGDAQTAKIKLISLYSNNGQLNEAELLIKEIESASDSVKRQIYPESITEFHYVKWKFYELAQNSQKAYANLDRYHFLKDSTETANQKHRYVDVEHGLRDAEKAQLIQLLEKDAQSKQFIIMGGVLMIILIFMILYIVFKNLKRSKANIDKLNVAKDTVQNQYVQLKQVVSVLEKSHLENATIMKVVAHDLRGPVSGMTNAAKLMLEEDGLSEMNYRMLHLVQDAGVNALTLINEMLNVHHGLGETEPTNISTLLDSCVSLLQFRAEAKSQKIVVAADDLIVSVNKDKIIRVISNLLTNAIKFSLINSIISITAVKKEQELVISITDKGVGIPEHMGDSIFDMFSKNGRVGTASEESFGMGLAISKQIIESHNGRIWYTSTVGLGTVFYFTLPL